MSKASEYFGGQRFEESSAKKGIASHVEMEESRKKKIKVLVDLSQRFETKKEDQLVK